MIEMERIGKVFYVKLLTFLGLLATVLEVIVATILIQCQLVIFLD